MAMMMVMSLGNPCFDVTMFNLDFARGKSTGGSSVTRSHRRYGTMIIVIIVMVVVMRPMLMMIPLTGVVILVISVMTIVIMMVIMMTSTVVFMAVFMTVSIMIHARQVNMIFSQDKGQGNIDQDTNRGNATHDLALHECVGG